MLVESKRGQVGIFVNVNVKGAEAGSLGRAPSTRAPRLKDLSLES